jgi:hypothetical protein
MILPLKTPESAVIIDNKGTSKTNPKKRNCRILENLWGHISGQIKKRPKRKTFQSLIFIGGEDGTRTHDLLTASQAL